MRRKTPVFSILLLAISSLTVFSCTKETIRETIVQRDSIIVRRDSIVLKQDVAKLFAKKWFFQSHEIESYTGSTLTGKKTENFVSANFYNQFRPDGTYTNIDLGGTTNGTWALVDDNLYVFDKNTVNERYYFILSISATAMINRGPFTMKTQLYRDYLATAYFKNAQ